MTLIFVHCISYIFGKRLIRVVVIPAFFWSYINNVVVVEDKSEYQFQMDLTNG